MDKARLVLINDPEVSQVEVRDCGDPLVSLLQFPNLLIDDSRRDVQRISPSIAFLRRSVITRLLEAQTYLPSGVSLLIKEGHRPVDVQRALYLSYRGRMAGANPGWSEERLKDEVSKYVASPEGIPPHSTGGAVDLTLIDSDGNELNMGTRVNADPATTRNATFTAAPNIDAAAQANRLFLVRAMTTARFVNYPTEWWHWSFGDQYWAFVSGHPFAIFGRSPVQP